MRQRREKAAPSAHMTPVVARQTGPTICNASTPPLDDPPAADDIPPLTNPTTVTTTPTTRNATDSMNMHQHARTYPGLYEHVRACTDMPGLA